VEICCVPNKPGLTFAVIAVLFLVLWVLNRFVPVEWDPAASTVAAAVFLTLPILGLYFGAAMDWTLPRAVGFLLGSLAALGLLYFSSQLAKGTVIEGFHSGLLQLARLAWPMALGVIVASLIRDKSMLLPIAIVLATVDMLAVFAPAGTVNQGLRNPVVRQAFDVVAVEVPRAGRPEPSVQIGPADPLFLGMFFTTIFRFRMRMRRTLYWMIPALVIYLFIVLAFGGTTLLGVPLGALPALLPIGAVIIAANWGEFDQSQSERLMTFVVLIICLGVIVWAAKYWGKATSNEKADTITSVA
jgi:hypothetical protein